MLVAHTHKMRIPTRLLLFYELQSATGSQRERKGGRGSSESYVCMPDIGGVIANLYSAAKVMDDVTWVGLSGNIGLCVAVCVCVYGCVRHLRTSFLSDVLLSIHGPWIYCRNCLQSHASTGAGVNSLGHIWVKLSNRCV